MAYTIAYPIFCPYTLKNQELHIYGFPSIIRNKKNWKWLIMKARSGQNHDNKIASQVDFNPTAANIMDMLCIFSALVPIFSNRSYFCFNYRNNFFIHAMNYFSVVLRIIFLMCIKNYFLIGPRIIFRGIANLFFGLQCIAGLAFEVDWFESPDFVGRPVWKLC